jgi:hypothetical protein
MEKSEREELLRDVLDAIDEHVAACGIPEERTGYNVLAQRVTAHFADYDALEESHAHADKHRVALEAKLAEAEKDRERLKREVARLNDDVFSMSLIGAAREGDRLSIVWKIGPGRRESS